MCTARKEVEDVMFGAIDDLLAKTSINPKDIEILIVNCSLFNPTPSLSANIVNHYKFRGNIKSFNLGGMGSKVKVYIPDFKLGFEHFCIHTGGRAILDELEKNLQLSP
ncbi:hypothetical protein HN51_048503 [Arachis hypogaea]